MRAVNHAPGRINPMAQHVRPYVEREGVGPPRRPPRRGRARPPLHRPPPRPRGHVAAGVRRPAPGRPHRPPARPHRRDDGPQRPDRPSIDLPRRRPDLGRSRWRCWRRNCAEFGIRLYPMGDAGPGHRARDRARARAHAAGHDDRVRRQPHLHARRVRRAGVRHRHQRGRARARHADAAAGEAGHDGGHRRRRPARAASPRRTSCSRSSTASAPAAGSARSSSTAARPSARSRWKGA